LGVFLKYIPVYINIYRDIAGLGVFLKYISGYINISLGIEQGWSISKIYS